MNLALFCNFLWLALGVHLTGALMCTSRQDEVMCGAPEVVAAGSTGSIPFKPVVMVQSYQTECKVALLDEYRTADGSCNHVANLGRANAPVARLLPPAYDDTLNAPRALGTDGLPLPFPGDVSRLIHTDRDAFSGRTLLLMQWGQFIDHDLTLFPTATATNRTLKCCGPDGLPLPFRVDKECLPIQLSAQDRRFRGSCMEFARSIPARNSAGGKLFPREQVNAVTSFLDGSVIYGSNLDLQHRLRESTPRGPGFLMATSFSDLLPAVNAGEENCIHRPGEFCFLAGDIRVNEQAGLTVMHTTWVRIHNIIAREIRLRRPNDSSEQLFQLTRKIVVAIVQNIHYSEWLPRIVGPDVMSDYSLWTGKISPPRRTAYVSLIDPRIVNAFSTAAFRFGHSMIPREYNISGRLIPLREIFNRPDLVFDHFNDVLLALVNPIRRGQAQLFDRHIVEEVTGHLFEPRDQLPNAPSRGLDLASLNIQRGRDHGLPPYNHFRKLCGLEPFANFSQFSDDNDVAASLKQLYRSTDNVDLFPGGLLEKPLPGAAVGPTFACIIAQQFFSLKYGDRFYFQTSRQREGFTDGQLNAILNVTLAKVCCQNKSVRDVQESVFLLPSERNPLIPCSQLRAEFLDYDLWADTDD